MTDGRFVVLMGAVAALVLAGVVWMLVQFVGDTPWRDAYGGGTDAFGVVLTVFFGFVMLAVGGGAVAMFLGALRDWQGTLPRPSGGARARPAGPPVRWPGGTAGLAGTLGTGGIGPGAETSGIGPQGASGMEVGEVASGEAGGEGGGGGDSGGGDFGGGDFGGGGSGGGWS